MGRRREARWEARREAQLQARLQAMVRAAGGGFGEPAHGGRARLYLVAGAVPPLLKSVWLARVLYARVLYDEVCASAQAVLHFVVIGMAELFPLYASSPTGLRLREHEVGLALAPLAVSLFTFPFAYVVLEKRYGARAMLRLGWTAFIVVNATLPQLRVLRDTPALLWPCLVVVGLTRGVGGNSSFPSISLLLNSLLTENLGAMNGFALSVSSLSRAASPLICGSLFSAATARGESPLEALPFYLLCVLCLLGMWLSTFLPPRASQCTGGAPPVGDEVYR